MHRISNLIEHLRGQWQLIQIQEHQMAETWQDSTYVRFRIRHWAKWEKTIPDLFPALNKLDNVIQRALTVTKDH